MKILVVTQYFWPESFRVNDFVLGLKELGHDVKVLTGKPNYPRGKFFNGYSIFGRRYEQWNQISVTRVPILPRGSNGISLALNYLSFIISGSIRAWLMKEIPEVVIAYQQSPVTAVIPAIIIRKRFKMPLYVYIQDLWPESVMATTNLNNKIIVSVLNSLTNFVYNNADVILIQSQAFREHLLTRVHSHVHIEYLPNSTDKFYHPTGKVSEYAKYFFGKINIVFAGNIGEAQDFETLVQAAVIVKEFDSSIIWTIIGDGRKKLEIQKMVKEKNVGDVFNFIGSFPSQRMPFFFAYSDALLISLKDELIFSLTLPSKLQSYMACGKPIIGSINGEGAAIIKEAGCGFVSDAGDSEMLAQNILHFKELNISQRQQMGKNALSYFNKAFNRGKILARIDYILKNTKRTTNA